MKKTLLIATITLGLTQVARADPVVVGTGFSPPEFTALLGETLVIGILLARRKFDFVRVLYTWIFVTLVTYWLLMLGGGLTVAGLDSVLPESSVRGIITPLVVFLVFEVLVVLIEAHVIVRFAAHKFFRNSDEPFAKQSALAVAIAGNVVSLGVGLLWLFG